MMIKIKSKQLVKRTVLASTLICGFELMAINAKANHVQAAQTQPQATNTTQQVSTAAPQASQIGENNTNMTDAQFIKVLTPDVEKVARQYHLYPSVMMAQAALESGFGRSGLATEANNLFGIKGSYKGQSIVMPTQEYNNAGQSYWIDAAFRKYPSWYASVLDNAQLLRNNGTFYQGAWRENAANYEAAAQALGQHYATSPIYANSLISLIKSFDLDDKLDNFNWRGVVNSLNHNKDVQKLVNNLHAHKNISKNIHQIEKDLGHHKSEVHSFVKHLNQPKKRHLVVQKVIHNVKKLVNADYVAYYGYNVVPLAANYRSYHLYDHLGKTGEGQWQALKHVYVDMSATYKGQTYYRVRFTPYTHHMHWILSDALEFDKPSYQKADFSIFKEQLDLHRAYNYPMGSKMVDSVSANDFNQKILKGDQYTIIKSGNHYQMWFHVHGRKGKSAWIATDPYRSTHYFAISKPATLSSNYMKYHLYDHAQDVAYILRDNVSWADMPLKAQSQIQVDRLAYNSLNNSWWVRFNFAGQEFWINKRALN